MQELLIEISDIDSDLTSYNWRYDGGYAVRNWTLQDSLPRRTICLHTVILERKLGRSIKKGMLPDHRDRNGLNNQRENLREVTYSQNSMNSKLSRRNTSGYRGVHRNGQNWLSHILIDKKRINLGTYETPEEAYGAYLLACDEYGKDRPPENQGLRNDEICVTIRLTKYKWKVQMTLKKPWDKVRCKETDEVFLSIADAHIRTGVSATKIRISLASGAVVDGMTFVREKYGSLHPLPEGQDFFTPPKWQEEMEDDRGKKGRVGWLDLGVEKGVREFAMIYSGQALQCNETGAFYNSIADASRETGISESQIRISLDSGATVVGKTFVRMGQGVVHAHPMTMATKMLKRPDSNKVPRRKSRKPPPEKNLRSTLPMSEYFKSLREQPDADADSDPEPTPAEKDE